MLENKLMLMSVSCLQSQCTKANQLHTALALTADMRSRGIQVNNHTYSALLNICVKTNELDLALDVFQQLLAEGLSPNIVTYNILLEVYAKQGMWQQAVQTLSMIYSQVRSDPGSFKILCREQSLPSQAHAACPTKSLDMCDGWH